MADQERGTEIEKEQEMAQPETEEVNKEETAKTQSPEEDTGQEEQTADNGGDEEEQGPPEGEDPKTWAEKRAAKKQAKLDKKAQGYKDQIELLEDKVKRQLAEFENFRNRTEKEKHAMFETGAKSVVEKILPVVDNFERGLATVPEDKKEDPFVDGMMHVYKQLLTELENLGVKPIEAVGQEFDPNLHNAVMQVESEEYESGTVAQELQKGYTYRDSVVRHSMVAVVE
ncbi:nucleotide exchange factor GrpE [Acetatifactor muris]|jgi:molecular chaperone GrpE|uniref:Protein GrpE n=1 Tax=Acetatifactor muris TaxID=879566 RepID=A0A2K4ZIG1_9FIRM|nr:nucleotide exchange factor GrpE [Acetatifactor muris]MCR2048388.1 nucleotide exchange factor GrpE [Acetatifactor muris]SOY30192.1 heat shock protein GrpE [Acetatifactor muris]